MPSEFNINCESLALVRMLTLTYLGLVNRACGCQLTRTLLQGNVCGKRKRGRPRLNHADNIAKLWSRPIEVFNKQLKTAPTMNQECNKDSMAKDLSLAEYVDETVIAIDAIICNHVFSHGRCNMCLGFC